MTRRTHPLAPLLILIALLSSVRAEPVVLYEKVSPFGPVIVTEEYGLRTLMFEKGGARQSVVKLGDPEHLALPYAQVAFSGLALCEGPKRVLVVGLGGGTLPMFLRHHYPEATIDGVDINPAVVEVARQFLGFREDARMRGIVADGRAFIEQTREPYDLIFLDAFGADSVPPSLSTIEFLQAVRRAVRPSGVVVGNIWDRAYNSLYDAMVRTYQEAFDDLYVIDVAGVGNRILLALPRSLNLSREALATRAGHVSRTKRFRYDLSALITAGYAHAATPSGNARVLRDAEMLPKK
jgi:spermidine synthase